MSIVINSGVLRKKDKLSDIYRAVSAAYHAPHPRLIERRKLQRDGVPGAC